MAGHLQKAAALMQIASGSVPKKKNQLILIANIFYRGRLSPSKKGPRTQI